MQAQHPARLKYTKNNIALGGGGVEKWKNLNFRFVYLSFVQDCVCLRKKVVGDRESNENIVYSRGTEILIAHFYHFDYGILRSWLPKFAQLD